MPDSIPADSVGPALAVRSNRGEQAALGAGIVVSILLAWFASRLFGVPASLHRAGILLQQGSGIVAILVVLFVFAASAVLSSVITGRISYDAGLYCACAALATFSVRLGPTRFAMFAAMAIELLLLFAGVIGVWLLLHRTSKTGLLPPEILPDPNEEDEPLDQKLLACAAQSVMMIILLMVVVQYDDKVQCLASVGVAAYLATLGAYQFIPTFPSIWFWTGPLIVGLVGYVMQAISHPYWTIGDTGGFFAALARPQPLDYASLGVAGALLGYWTASRWRRVKIEEQLDDEAEDLAEPSTIV